MYAVIFEVQPHPEHNEAYLNMAAELRSELEKIDGFISIERFASLSDEGKILSLSFFRDETAIKAWREQLDHRRAQQLGRDRLFEDYRLRIATVVRDYGLSERDEAPQHFPEVKKRATSVERGDTRGIDRDAMT